MFYKKAAFKNFAIFIGKHLSWSLFLINLQACKPATILQDICERLVLNLLIQSESNNRKNRRMQIRIQRRIQNPVKNLRWSFLQKYLIVFNR